MGELTKLIEEVIRKTLEETILKNVQTAINTTIRSRDQTEVSRNVFALDQ